MTTYKKTQEPLEDELPVPEDASDDERKRIREKNEKIRKRNAERLANAEIVSGE